MTLQKGRRPHTGTDGDGLQELRQRDSLPPHRHQHENNSTICGDGASDAIALLVRELVAVGVDAGLAASIVARAHAAGTARRSPGAIRQERYRERQRHKASHVTDGDAAESPPKILPRKTPSYNTPVSDPDGSAAAAALELTEIEIMHEPPRAKLFRLGKTLLVSFGVAEKRTGPLIGHWLKLRNDPAGVLAAIQFARDQNVADPVAYISTVISHGKKHDRTARQHPSELAFELAAEIRERELAAGVGRPPHAL